MRHPVVAEPPDDFVGQVTPDGIRLIVKGGGLDLRLDDWSAKRSGMLLALGWTLLALSVARAVEGSIGTGPAFLLVLSVTPIALVLAMVEARFAPTTSNHLELTATHLVIDGWRLPLASISRLERDDDVVTVVADGNRFRLNTDKSDPDHVAWFLAQLASRRAHRDGSRAEIPAELASMAARRAPNTHDSTRGD